MQIVTHHSAVRGDQRRQGVELSVELSVVLRLMQPAVQCLTEMRFQAIHAGELF
ncbi:hypothetical protein D3C73_1613110 [compost metagenome]